MRYGSSTAMLLCYIWRWAPALAHIHLAGREPLGSGPTLKPYDPIGEVSPQVPNGLHIGLNKWRHFRVASRASLPQIFENSNYRQFVNRVHATPRR